MDIIGSVLKQEVEERDRPFIAITGFETEATIKDDGSTDIRDVVTWVKKGQSIQNEQRGLIRLMPRYNAQEWSYIEPFYKAWKAKEEAPIDGTPLAAWPGSTAAMIKVLGTVNIRTVEDFCQMEDSAISKLAMPGLREKQRICRQFLESMKNTAPQVAKLAKMEEENEILRARLDEQAKQIEQLVAAQEKRGPGRPRKEVEAA
jgi:hypothetical protein